MPISMRTRFVYASGMIVLGAVIAGTYASPVHAGPSVRTVQLRDDCEPASFNVAVGPGTCVGGGDTAFPDFIADVIATGSSEKWRFNPSKTEADRRVKAENRGGETHSLTEVAHFGGGFIAVLNGGLTPLAECAARDEHGNLVAALPAILTFVPPGETLTTEPLTKGVHTFQCCIHPWMHTTVVVR